MRDKRTGLLQGLFFFAMRFLPVLTRRSSDRLFKKKTERGDAFKTDVITDLGYRQVIAGQPYARLFHPFLGQVLMRCL